MSRRYPQKYPRDAAAAGGGQWTLAENKRAESSGIRACCRTSLEVLGSPWMAPRAGLEVSRKYLTGNDRRNTGKAYTPSDTPKRRRCKFTVEWVDGRLPTSLSSAASLPKDQPVIVNKLRGMNRSFSSQSRSYEIVLTATGRTSGRRIAQATCVVDGSGEIIAFNGMRPARSANRAVAASEVTAAR